MPQLPNDENSSSNSLTKITTLRLAVNYIAALSEMLRESDEAAAAEQQPTTHGADDNANIMPSSERHDNVSPTSDQACASTSLQQDPLPSFSSIGLTSLDLNLSGLADADLVSELDSSFLTRQDISNRPGSCTSSDLASYHSPSTTETESLESYTSACGGWDFNDEDGLDVPDTFDLILESDTEANI